MSIFEDSAFTGSLAQGFNLVDQIGMDRRRRKGDRLAVDPNATWEDLARYADVSPGALARLNEMRTNRAMSVYQGIGRPPPPQGLSQALEREPNLPPAAPLWDPTRGRGALESVDLDLVDQFDPEYQNMSLSRKAQDEVEGLGHSIFGGLSEVATTLVGANRGSDLLNTIGGNIYLPNEFMTPEQIRQLPITEQAAAIRRNKELIQNLKAPSDYPDNFGPEATIDRVDRLRKGSMDITLFALDEERDAVREYKRLLDPSLQGDSVIRNLADEGDYEAITNRWINDRNTLLDAMPNMVADVDAKMRPFFEQHYNAIVARASSEGLSDEETRSFRLSARRFHATANEMYKDFQPAVAAGVQGGSAPRPGTNADLTAQIFTAITEGSPSLYTPLSNSQIRSAVTQVQRISPSKRLTNRQIDAIRHLHAMNILSQGDVRHILDTGYLPQNKDIGELKTGADGGIYRIYSDNSAALIIPGKSTTAGQNARQNAFTADTNVIVDTVFDTRYGKQASEHKDYFYSFFAQHEAEIKDRYDLADEGSVRRFINRYADSHVLYYGPTDRYTQADVDPFEDDWFTSGNPTFAQVFFDEEGANIAAEAEDRGLANITPLDPKRPGAGVNVDRFRDEVAAGVYGVEAQIWIQGKSNEEIAQVLIAMKAQSEGA